MILAGQMINYEKYKEQLNMLPAPIMPSQLPKVRVDLKGLIAYARSKGVKTDELTEQEMDQFISGRTSESLQQELNATIKYNTLSEWNAKYSE